ncbi:MAG: MATE family efflux transporter [Phascolarctobacterium sp.]|nr:MATE family efflux transporter [Phascolarctobacterium sp.]
MIKALDRNYRDKLRRLLSVMLPIICTQIAIMGMNFFDASMSGQAGDVDLAGAAIGGNIWMPIQTGISGILMAAMPLVANLLGAGEKEKITVVVRHGLFLASAFALVVLGAGIAILPHFLQGMGLEPEVYHVALWYLAGLGLGVVPFFMITPLRSLVDTLGYTHLTMRIYLLALPINACLNYVLIFGKLGLPRLGGIGAGVASGLTFWLLLGIFAWVISSLAPFKNYHVFGFMRPAYSWLKEYLRIGVPMGISIFMETSIFGVVALFIAKFGTETIAAHQAALNFSSLIYMLPLSFSLALTIVVGVEYGAKNYQGARDYVTIGLQTSLGIAGFYMLAEYILREQIAFIYTNNVEVVALVKVFLLYAIGWQAGDAIAAPIQGILRGYKDVDATFWASMLAYWGICLPLGLFLDYKVGNGAFAYWQSLDCGVISSATLLSIRLLWLQKRISNK